MGTTRVRPIAVLGLLTTTVATAQILAGGVIRVIDPRGETFGFEPVWVRLLTATWFGAGLLLVAAVSGVAAIVRTAENVDDPSLAQWSRIVRVHILVLSAAASGFALCLGWDELGDDVLREAVPWAIGATGVLIAIAVVICLFCWIVQRIHAKRRRYPANIDDVPEPFRSSAKDRGPVWPGVRDALHGGILGAALAIAWAFRPDAPGRLGVIVVGGIAIVILGFLALLAWDVDTKEEREGDAVRDRIARVRAGGERVQAEVVSVDRHEWSLPYVTHGVVRFTLTARYDTLRGPRVYSGDILVEVVDAPIVGGTVLVWHLSDADEDRYMEPDPDSIRDPDAKTIYDRPNY